MAGTWLFGRYRLEPALRRLHADGRSRELDARALAVLECLLRHAERVVPRATLTAEAWPDADTVLDSAVSKVMRRLRTALGDSSGHVLQTIYGEGYRLALPAVQLGTAPARPQQPASRQTPPAPIAAAAADSAREPSPAPGSPVDTRRAPGTWRVWLPWIIAATATLVATRLAWLLLRPAGAG
ncbi:winged helix-turn-helix domain-containing protein [Luteimonas sp. MJ204]|uniref:winged helix-turn-helix domain-containing protein n=1 Tax=Luteimonas sp. MJ145 TaxID=3129234 RepID=UPI0031BB3B85